MVHNDVVKVSEALQDIVGGVTVHTARGRGKVASPEIHASKGTQTFVPFFSDKYVLEVIIAEAKEDQVIKIIRENTKTGKIFIYPDVEAIDIESGTKGESVI